MKVSGLKAEEYFNEAIMYVDNSDYENAEKSYLNAIKLQRDFIEAYLGLGFLYIQTLENKKAIAFLEKAKLLLAKDANIFALLGSAYLLNGEEQKAMAIWKRAIEINKDELIGIIMYLCDILKEDERINDGVTIIECLIKCKIHEVDVYGILAGMKLFLEEFDEAENIAKKIFEIDSEDITGYQILGAIANLKEDYEEALIIYKKIIELSPELTMPYANMAMIYAEMGNTKDALKMIDKVLEDDDVDMIAHFMCANAYCELRKPKLAIKILTNMLKIEPEQIDAVTLLLELAIEQNDQKTLKWLNDEILVNYDYDLDDFAEEVRNTLAELEMEDKKKQ